MPKPKAKPNPAIPRGSEYSTSCIRKWFFEWRIFGSGIVPRQRVISQSILTGIFGHIAAVERDCKTALSRLRKECPDLPTPDPLDTLRIEAMNKAGVFKPFQAHSDPDDGAYIQEPACRNASIPVIVHPDLLWEFGQRRRVVDFKFTTTSNLHMYNREAIALSPQLCRYFAVLRAEKVIYHIFALPQIKPDSRKKETNAQFVQRATEKIANDLESHYRRLEFNPDDALFTPAEVRDQVLRQFDARKDAIRLHRVQKTLQAAMNLPCDQGACVGKFNSICPYVGPCRNGERIDLDDPQGPFVPRPMTPQDRSKTIISID